MSQYVASGQKSVDERKAKKTDEDVALSEDMEKHTDTSQLGAKEGYKARPTPTPNPEDPRLKGLNGLALVAMKRKIAQEQALKGTAKEQAEELRKSGR